MNYEEKLYRKVGKRYQEVSMPERYDMQDGIWLVQNNPYSKNMSSLYWRVGDLKRPADIVTHASLQVLEDDLSRYVFKLTEKDSDEFKEAVEISGGYLKSPVGFYNISASQFVNLILRRIALHLEDGEKINWDSLQHKFRDETQLYEKPEFENGVKVLYMFTDWLKKNNIKFRQNNNIGE
jgi:hypothetical protein